MNLLPEGSAALVETLRTRFNRHMHRHQNLIWSEVETRLNAEQRRLWTLSEMERTGGEPDVVGLDDESGTIVFFDCSAESPKGRRSLCYDREALDARKEHKPAGSALDMAASIGVELLTVQEYEALQELGPFDTKTSSWVATPPEVRALGGALFGDHRYGRTFIYHNGAQSYYAARGFRGKVRV